jgi:hypothetical protein
MTPLLATRRLIQSSPTRRSANAARSSAGPASGLRVANRSAGVQRPSDWCGRSVLYSTIQASIACCATARDGNAVPVSSSRRSVPWKRSIFPVVVGDRGAVSRCRMPFS